MFIHLELSGCTPLRCAELCKQAQGSVFLNCFIRECLPAAALGVTAGTKPWATCQRTFQNAQKWPPEDLSIANQTWAFLLHSVSSFSLACGELCRQKTQALHSTKPISRALYYKKNLKILSQNHRIVQVEKELYDRQVQLLTQHSKAIIKPRPHVPHLHIYLEIIRTDSKGKVGDEKQTVCTAKLLHWPAFWIAKAIHQKGTVQVASLAIGGIAYLQNLGQ